MKCPSNYEEARSPCKGERRVAAEFKEPVLKTSPLKGCVNFLVKPQYSPNVVKAIFPVDDDVKGVHNKENKNKDRNHDRTLEEVTQGCEAFEDSGYLSLQNSQIIEQEDHKDNIEEQLGKSPGQIVFSSSPAAINNHGTTNRSVSILPILKFEHAVCAELTKSFKRTQTYDWTVISRIARDFDLDRVIGGSIGLDGVDVLRALIKRGMRHILTQILGQLEDMDLMNCKKVSKTWREIISQDASSVHRCQQAEQRLRDSIPPGVENSPVCALTRDQTLNRVVLSCMQSVASGLRSAKRMPSQRDSTQSSQPHCSRPTHFREYQEAASCLKTHESLKRCGRCGSPAKHSAMSQRATCTRLSCAFDFCTQCHGPFHGSLACHTVNPRRPTTSRTPPLLIGSSRSKRNIRRL